MEHDLKEFYDLAIAKFGSKFSMFPIQVTDENLEMMNKKFDSNVTKEDFGSYCQVWLLEPVCPACGASLNGLFGSFEWGICHGEGFCGECNKVTLKYYHYIGDCKVPIKAFSLVGF